MDRPGRQLEACCPVAVQFDADIWGRGLASCFSAGTRCLAPGQMKKLNHPQIEYIHAPPGLRQDGDIIVTGANRVVRRMWLHLGSLNGNHPLWLQGNGSRGKWFIGRWFSPVGHQGSGDLRGQHPVRRDASVAEVTHFEYYSLLEKRHVNSPRSSLVCSTARSFQNGLLSVRNCGEADKEH